MFTLVLSPPLDPGVSSRTRTPPAERLLRPSDDPRPEPSGSVDPIPLITAGLRCSVSAPLLLSAGPESVSVDPSSSLTEQKTLSLTWIDPLHRAPPLISSYLCRFRLRLHRDVQRPETRFMSFWMWTCPSLEVLSRTFWTRTSIWFIWSSFSGNSARTL